MGVVVVAVGIVAVIGGDDGHAVFFCKAQEGQVDFVLIGQVMPLQLYIVIVAKEVQPPFEFFLCFFFAVM